jgi:outer membrane protein assembly factor BamB
MKLDKKTDHARFRFDDLVIWRTRLPKAVHAVLPPSNNRPNPLATGKLVYVSVFSPGAVCALIRKTGKLLWHRELPGLGGSEVQLAQRKLFAKTANTLFALEPETGRTIWSFCPYGESGETIYSSPTIYRNSVFIGDRRGYLHCLDCQNGETRWKVRTNKAKNGDLNTTPIIVKGLVIVGTNAKMAAAYDVKTGKRKWIRKLDGPSVLGPLLHRGLIVTITDSIYLMKPGTGRVVRRFSWKAGKVAEVESTSLGVIAVLRGKYPPDGNFKLVSLNLSGMRFTETCRAFVPFLRYVSGKQLIYVSHLEGISIRKPQSGHLLHEIHRRSRPAGNGPVDVKRNTIYVLTGDGYVYALRHPSV